MRALRFILVVSLLLTGACGRLGSSYIEIKNGSRLPLSAVNVQLGGKRYNVDLIKPNATEKVTFEPVSDSTVRIEFVRGQEPGVHTCLGDVYVTNGSSMRISAVIGPENTCEVSEVD